jgi:hypothetical protein
MIASYCLWELKCRIFFVKFQGIGGGVGSLLKNKAIIRWVLTLCFIFAQPLWSMEADKVESGQAEPSLLEN